MAEPRVYSGVNAVLFSPTISVSVPLCVGFVLRRSAPMAAKVDYHGSGCSLLRVQLP